VSGTTYRTLTNRPDVVLHDKIREGLPTDRIAILDYLNGKAKETEKLSKNKDLDIEIGRARKMKKKIVPVITGGLATNKMDQVRAFSCSQATYRP
jgi:hypothetical protein